MRFHKFEIIWGWRCSCHIAWCIHIETPCRFRILTDSVHVCCTWMNGKAYSHIVGCLLGLQSQISAKSQQSVLKLIEEILDPLPQPSTTNRQPPRGPACDRLLVHLWQVQRGSRQPRPEAKLQNLENATQQRCSRCAEKLLQKYCSFSHHILYCWSNRNKCVRQLLQSFISFNFNITSMTTNATKCQPLPLGLTLPTMLERHLSGWCPCKWRRLHRPGLQSKSTPSFGCLMKSCYGYPSRISTPLKKNRTASPPSTASVALLKRLLVASNASAADRPWDDCWILIFREHR